MLEVYTCVTMEDLFEINALLDMQADMKYQIQRES